MGELAEKAEAAGFDGVFLRDHVVRPSAGLAVCDPWIALSAIALCTTRITIGTWTTPLARRRPQEVARQAVALDRLSGGRFVLGAGDADGGGESGEGDGRDGTGGADSRDRAGGLDGADGTGDAHGGDGSGGDGRPYAAGARGDGPAQPPAGSTADLPDVPRPRDAVLDESLDVICRLWSGERTTHAGPHFRIEDVRSLPRPVQRPRIPIWVAARPGDTAPLRRAARFDGLCPETSPEGLRGMLAEIERRRGGLDGFDVAVGGPPGADPAPYRDAGATWWVMRFPDTVGARDVSAALDRFDARPSS
ncbi:LLM class flavin-dependent oxidoreductase [Streptomonospora mangrovi]|uniref:LLM class flavin-dependent oxidoreductase n=1 Tax=Streptomonospora mangrovi TaxID=2883123 RepID=UPI0022DD51A2|nr:LLM class flavin-dependent oxidoreductase [Streptomonospora mangrovi]